MKIEIVGGRLQRFEALGFSIDRTKAPVAPIGATEPAFAVPGIGGAWSYLFRHVHEAFTGAFQRNHTEHTESVLSYPTVYACVTLIASDIGKVRVKLVAKDANGIWEESENAAYSPVLRKQNDYQTRIKFFEWWMISKLVHGNTYILKARDESHKVRRLYILDPCRVRPLVAPDGSVFYELGRDNLTPIDAEPGKDTVVVPASEIIHDVMVPLFHPLCGVSPIFACAVAALHGLHIQGNASKFFANGSMPGGVLTAPGNPKQETIDRIKKYWEENFSGDNVGKIAILGDGLTYQPMAFNAVDSELVKQLGWTDEKICSVFHVPGYMVGVGPMPNYNNIEALNQQYYSQCLQTLFESIEILLDEGLELAKPYGTEFELDDLLKMDTATLIESEKNAIGAGLKAPNESRKRLNLPPVKGGQTPYLQQQNYSLAALDARDSAGPAPSSTTPSPAPSQPQLPAAKDLEIDAEATREFLMLHMRQTAELHSAA